MADRKISEFANRTAAQLTPADTIPVVADIGLPGTPVLENFYSSIADIAKLGVSSYNGYVGDLTVYTTGMSGGGMLSAPDRNVKWTSRFVIISQGRGPQIPDGYFDINFPPVGTIIKGVGGQSDVVSTATGIQLPVWATLWYELPLGLPSPTVNTNFYVSTYGSSGDFTAPPHFVKIAWHNSDESLVYFADGSRISTNNTYPPFDFRGISSWESVPQTGANPACRINLSCRMEEFGAMVRLRGIVTPTSNSSAGVPTDAVLGVLNPLYRPVVPGYYSNDEPNIVLLCGTSSTNAVSTPHNMIINTNGTISWQGKPAGFALHVDGSWSK